MSMRKIKNAVNNTTGELIYFKGHAQATYMSDGSTVEDTINNIESKIDLSDYVKSEELEGYAKTSDIPSLEGYAKEEDIPSLDGYAKTEDIPSLDGYAKTSELPNFDEFAKIEDIPSLEEYAKTEDIPSLYGYATQQWVNEQEFAHQDDLLNMSFNDIQDSPITENNDGEVNIVDDKGNIALKVNEEGLYVKDVIAGEHVLSQKVGVNELKTINGQSILGSGDITIEGGGGNVDLSNYATKAELAQKQDVISDIDTIRTNAANYKGTVTSIKIDNVSKSPSNGVVDLGYINKQLSTSTSSSMTLSPNVYYRNTNTSLSSLTITLGGVSNSNIINEYFVEFTTRSSGTTVSFPSSVKWVDGITPTWEAGYTYHVSIVNNLGVVVKFK